jgi:16S rRNA pseudouridine516 synthase
MKLGKYIANLGYGSRREVVRLFEQRRITTRDGQPLEAESAAAHDDIRVDGAPLDPPPGSLLMLHKPVGYVCSSKDVHPLAYDLLPARFLLRTPVMAPIGRLDLDTSGLLLLTDDGALNHRIASPRRHLPKCYEARLAEELRGDEGAIFGAGTLMLERELEPLAPAHLEVIAPRIARLTVTEGRYHQVRRMFAAVGNHVTALHRVAIGALTLGDLAAGAWRLVSDDERAQLLG